nr:MAG TPA: hypothetical protein [Caudoviricetes sp.]
MRYDRCVLRCARYVPRMCHVRRSSKCCYINVCSTCSTCATLK